MSTLSIQCIYTDLHECDSWHKDGRRPACIMVSIVQSVTFLRQKLLGYPSHHPSKKCLLSCLQVEVVFAPNFPVPPVDSHFEAAPPFAADLQNVEIATNIIITVSLLLIIVLLHSCLYKGFR